MPILNAQARIPRNPANPDYLTCGTLQNRANTLLAEYKTASGPRADQILSELREIGRAWDQNCRGTWGSITRDLASVEPTFQDSDADGVFDEDEGVFGLDMYSPDSNRDGLADGSDPSWLVALNVAMPDAQLATFSADPHLLRLSLTSAALEAEGATLTRDPVAALDWLANVDALLGDCAPDPRTSIVSDVCIGTRVLSTQLAAQ